MNFNAEYAGHESVNDILKTEDKEKQSANKITKITNHGMLTGFSVTFTALRHQESILDEIITFLNHLMKQDNF